MYQCSGRSHATRAPAAASRSSHSPRRFFDPNASSSTFTRTPARARSARNAAIESAMAPGCEKYICTVIVSRAERMSRQSGG